MIDENWLSDVIFTTVQMSADLNKIGSGANGDFQTAALSSAVNTDETNELVIKSWMTKAQGRRSTLVFCVDISHVTNLTAKFREYGIDAQFVTGDTPPKVRSARIDEFRNGSFPVLLNCGVFTEGTDIPNIDCVLLARPTKSRNLLVQMIGRGMRLHKDKENCHIIDMVAALSTGVVSTPTLFGLDPDEVLQNVNSKAMYVLKEEKEKEKKEREKEQEEQATALQQRAAGKPSGAITFTDYDSLHDLIADTLNDKFVRSLSPYAWVSVGNDKYILSTNSGNYIAIEPHDTQEGFRAKYYMKLAGNTKYPYAAPRTIATGETLEHVVHAADTYAAEVFQHIWIAKNVPWRRTPASKAQIDFLNRSRPQEKQLKPGELLKGKAGDMITRLRYGAKGRFEKAAVKQRGEQRSKDRAQTLQQRLQGHVHVGPLGGV
jgi:ATP-dependent helicase IRC3